MKVSVIVAAYNAEKFLVETLESVLNQTLDEYEVIVVNDGSKDSTLEILRRYEAENLNLKVINQENQGVSAARNAGIEKACGQYIFFFDADDILELNALESLYNVAIKRKAELVIAGYDIFDDYKITPVNDIKELIMSEKIERYDEKILQTFSLSNKLLKKEIIDRYELRFPPISYSEDGVFLMNYVYHISSITGLDEVIFHYRRLNGQGNAITETISDAKVRDYIEAHRLILKSAEESIQRDFPKYQSLEEIKENESAVTSYLNRIIYKEINILIRQFYSKFWRLEEKTITLIVEEIEEKLKKMDMKHISLVANENPDVCLFHMEKQKKEEIKRAQFTAVLYGSNENKDDFIACLRSITAQTLVGIKIAVPEAMKGAIKEAELLYDNLVFEDVSDENTLFHKALENADTRYITFCDPKFIYANNGFKYMFKRFIKAKKDFLIELVYHTNYGEPQPVYLNRIAQESLNRGMEFTPELCMDHLLANKSFTVEFLQNCKMKPEESMLSRLEYFYRKGSYAFYNDAIVLYNDREDNFLSYTGTPQAHEFVKQYFTEEAVDLNSSDIVTDPGEAYVKLLDIEPETLFERIMLKAISYFTKKEIENRVLFVTIRRDGELEGNTKALYPYVKGEKVICAQKLPHNPIKMIKMLKLIATSKVIVTDDYLKYLRYFSLRPQQRVIQLWHACGAFKKFGQRGTNMSIKYDMATHTQYNMVCVSGGYIRPIYADAFNVNIKKVRTLGCPRTDDFFNAEIIEKKKSEIYEKHPELKNKSVIIYAPTFRDIGEGRTVFHPQIDFDRLSEKLLPDQMFIICPHPVMKNDIIPKNYPNIKVLRDFSTNDLMFISDMLITDYSSVIFEYALLKKPIIFYCYDLATYNRGFYLNYPEDLPGDVYQTQAELEEYLTDTDKHVITERYNLFVEKYMSGCDGKSCKRISDIINRYMEGK